jgi:hypothetical protein
MDPNDLRGQLLKLHEELTQIEQIDPRSRQPLAEIMEDVKRLLEPAGAPSAAVPARPSLSNRLGKIAVQFEADHPTLAESALRLVDLLVKAGL